MSERRVVDTLTPWERIQAGFPLPEDLQAVLALKAERDALRARVAELETENENAHEACTVLHRQSDTLASRITELEAWTIHESNINGTCCYDVMHIVCDGCACGRQSQKVPPC